MHISRSVFQNALTLDEWEKISNPQCSWEVQHIYSYSLFKTPTKCISLSLLLCINQPLHMFRSYIRPASGGS
jgi:hypothetical protein